MQIPEYLKRPEFEHVSKPSEADICWVYHTTIGDGYREVIGSRRGRRAQAGRMVNMMRGSNGWWWWQENGISAEAVLGQVRGGERHAPCDERTGQPPANDEPDIPVVCPSLLLVS